jgi:RimJ/RimL family protein N-acetyltransferase
MSGIVLRTPRLCLVPFARHRLDVLVAQWTEPDVRRWLWDGTAPSRGQVRDLIDASVASFAARRFGLWTIERSTEPGVVGFAGLRATPDGADVELHYGLGRAWWGRGFATEASLAVLRDAFDAVGLARVLVRMDGPNDASVAVARRLGARWVRTDPTGPLGTTIVHVVEPGMLRRV